MIQFEEKSHTYTRNNQQYISVTQLIDRYVPPFDSEYWSLYKAIKDVLSDRGLFYSYKMEVGGWKKVVPDFLKFGYHKDIDILIVRQQNWYLDKWGVKKREACEKGSRIHNELEGAVNHAREVDFE